MLTKCTIRTYSSEIVLNSPVLQAGLSLYFCDRDTSTTSALVTASAIDSRLVYAEKQNIKHEVRLLGSAKNHKKSLKR